MPPRLLSRLSFTPRLPVAAADGGVGPLRSGRRGLLARVLGMVPVPAPPHVFEVDAGSLCYASFARGGGGLRLERFEEAALPAETFQPGPLGGPLREREAFDRALAGLLARSQPQPAEASLVLPDRWLRLLFTDLEPGLGFQPTEDVLRFKLKRLVPFRVDELRLRAGIVPSLPTRDGGGEPAGFRLLYAFGIEQLFADLEAAFAARGVRLGQIASRTLYLASLLRENGRAQLLVDLESDGYSLAYVARGVPYVFRYRAATVDAADPAQSAPAAQDLRILLGFLAEQLPEHGVEEALVCGPPEAAASWVELLRDRFEIPSRVLAARDLDAAPAAPGVDWHRAAPLIAAASREVA